MSSEPLASLRWDHEISIATASSRKAAKWQNQSLKISQFVNRLRETHRTPETVEQYLATKKGDQDDIKDVGGFVGGMLKGGKRRKGHVANRTVITLDADFAKLGFLEGVREALEGVMWTVYSTHKHKPEQPRFRLLVYPDTPLSIDQYEPVARRIAERVDIDQFDSTTYDTVRLMCWPSTSIDGQYVFEHNDAAPLCVQDVLDSYADEGGWQNARSWPVSSRENRAIEKRISKQADPLTKKGIVGAFCRAVPLERALSEYLGDVYQREDDGRYTYAHGSTTKGLVVYEGKFAYSHHESDPASGQTCNSFDLVRIHRFGELDNEAREGTPTHKLPSYREMSEWARSIPEVRKALVEAGLETTAGDFEQFDDKAEGGQESESSSDLIGKLQTYEDGTVKGTFVNAVLILTEDPKVKDRMQFNSFRMVVENSDTGEEWEETDTYRVRVYVGRRYDVDFADAKIQQAIEKRAHDRAYHPVRDYLTALPDWDGTDRLERFLIDYLGTDDNAYTREAFKCWMTAAVYRVMEPGFKFDHALVVGGVQGIGKSSMVSILARGWYGELSSFDPKIAIEEITGSWLVEINEMGATNREELERQKAFLSATSTRVRLAYRRNSAEFKRQCVFIGTTNQTEYLKDSTGNRRWWPVQCQVERIDLEALEAERDQLWAEAFYRYAMDESVLLSQEALAIVQGEQEKALESDPIEGVIAEWLDRPASVERYDSDRRFENLDSYSGTETRQKVCVIEVWEDCLKGRGDPKRSDRLRIGAALERIGGWEKAGTMRFGERFGIQRGWRRKSD